MIFVDLANQSVFICSSKPRLWHVSDTSKDPLLPLLRLGVEGLLFWASSRCCIGSIASALEFSPPAVAGPILAAVMCRGQQMVSAPNSCPHGFTVYPLYSILKQEAISNRCHASSNKCLTSSSKKLVVTTFCNTTYLWLRRTEVKIPGLTSLLLCWLS